MRSCGGRAARVAPPEPSGPAVAARLAWSRPPAEERHGTPCRRVAEGRRWARAEPAAGAASSPCGEATCLATLFESCVPAGRCASKGAGGPHTSVSTVCYENGVSASSTNGWDGIDSVRGSLAVRRSGSDCYQITWRSNATTSYIVTDASGRQVATGVAAPDGSTVVVTCTNGNPIAVSADCLSPLPNNLDGCDLGTCPS